MTRKSPLLLDRIAGRGAPARLLHLGFAFRPRSWSCFVLGTSRGSRIYVRDRRSQPPHFSAQGPHSLHRWSRAWLHVRIPWGMLNSASRATPQTSEGMGPRQQELQKPSRWFQCAAKTASPCLSFILLTNPGTYPWLPSWIHLPASAPPEKSHSLPGPRASHPDPSVPRLTAGGTQKASHSCQGWWKEASITGA